jgi:pullulanase/glycogen debranching enzyme
LTNICSYAILAVCLMHKECITGLCDQASNLGRISVQVCGYGCPQQAFGLAHKTWEQSEQYPALCSRHLRGESRIVLPAEQRLKPGIHYAYRLDGPHDVHSSGDRFNRNKVLIGPYAKAIWTTLWSRAAASSPADNLHTSLRGIVVDASAYDWQGDRPLNRPISETIIYLVPIAKI